MKNTFIPMLLSALLFVCYACQDQKSKTMSEKGKEDASTEITTSSDDQVDSLVNNIDEKAVELEERTEELNQSAEELLNEI